MVLAAGLVPIKLSEPAPLFLLLRCYKYWGFPKGEIEAGEDPLKAALCELQEETGLTHVDFRWENNSYTTEVYSSGKKARYFLAKIIGDEPVSLLPHPESGIVEHHEYRWVTFNEGLKLTNPRITKVLELANRRITG